MARAWYVIECFDGKDAFVRLTLAAAGFNVWRPVREVRVTMRREGKKLAKRKTEKRYVARFGRYLFVQVDMNDSVRAAIREARGVYGWLCYAGTNEPARVPDALIEFYRSNVAKQIEYESALRIGDIGQINAGPFAQHRGIITDVDKRGGGVIEIDIFGRPTPVTFEAGHVDPVEPRCQRPIGDRRKSA